MPADFARSEVEYHVSERPLLPSGLPEQAAAVRVLGPAATSAWFTPRRFRTSPIFRYGAPVDTVEYALDDDLRPDEAFPWLGDGTTSVTVTQVGYQPDRVFPSSSADWNWSPFEPALALRDSALNTRAAGAIALGDNIDWPQATDLLVAFLDTVQRPDPAVAAALWALRQDGVAGHDATLARWADSEDLNVRLMLADCYAALRSPAAWDYLVAGMFSDLVCEVTDYTVCREALATHCKTWLYRLHAPAALPALRQRHKFLMAGRQDLPRDPGRRDLTATGKPYHGLRDLLAACGDREAWAEIRDEYLWQNTSLNGEVVVRDGRLPVMITSDSEMSDDPSTVEFVHGPLPARSGSRFSPHGPVLNDEMRRKLIASGELSRSATLDLIHQIGHFTVADEASLRRLWLACPIYRRGLHGTREPREFTGVPTKVTYDRTALACLTELGDRRMATDLWPIWQEWHRQDPVIAQVTLSALANTRDPQAYQALLTFMADWWQPVVAQQWGWRESVGHRPYGLASQLKPRGFDRAVWYAAPVSEFLTLVMSEATNQSRSLPWRLLWLSAAVRRARTALEIERIAPVLAELRVETGAGTPEQAQWFANLADRLAVLERDARCRGVSAHSAGASGASE